MKTKKTEELQMQEKNSANENVDEIVDETKAKMMDYVVKNVKFIKEKERIQTNKALANELKVSEATLTKVLAKDQMPSIYPFLYNLAQISKYSIDDIISTDLEEYERYDGEDQREYGHELEKSLGLYQLFYFKTSAMAGREMKDDADALDHGILLIYRTKEMKYRCAALFGLDEEKMREVYNGCKKNSSIRQKFNSWQAYQYLYDNHWTTLYEGVVESTRAHLYLSLSREGTDWVTMLTHWPGKIGDKYIGGLGMVSSLSKGRDTDPCMQYIGISRYELKASAEEICQMLYSRFQLSMPKYYEISPILNEMRKLNVESIQSDSDSAEGDITIPVFSNASKNYFLQGQISKLITDVVERNTHRVIRITGYNDDDWYHLVKHYRNVVS